MSAREFMGAPAPVCTVQRPFVGAIVQYVGKNGSALYAAVVTRVHPVRGPVGGWRDPVDLVCFNPSGGLMPKALVERAPDAPGDDPFWRWPIGTES